MSSEAIHIRRGTLADIPPLQQLFVETISYTCANDYDTAQIKVWTASITNKARWQAICTQQYLLIAQSGTTIVGFGTLYHADVIDMMYVHKNYQRQGIAHLLYQHLEKEALQRGKHTLYAEVSKTAKPFFERIGFVVMTEQTLILQDIAINNFKMVNKLAISL